MSNSGSQEEKGRPDCCQGDMLNLSPTMQIAALDTDARWVRSLDGSEYMPGLVGLNNMKANDYVNVIVQVIILHCESL